MKSRDYMSDTWCLLAGMTRNHGESFPESIEDTAFMEPKRESHVLLRLLVNLMMVISQLI